MPSAASLTGVWRPDAEGEKQLVRSQLQRIVSDGRFSASKRYPSLLQYIVEQTLAGKEDDLKERTLGVEVFHRSPDYDTNADPVVRLCAAEIRKRLAQYYQSPSHRDELRIELNPGSYIPLFLRPAPDAAAHEVVSEIPAPVLPLPASEAPYFEVVTADAASHSVQISSAKRMKNFFWLAALIGSTVMVVFLWSLRAQYSKHPAVQKSAIEKVWSPLLSSSNPILFSVGQRDLDAPPGSRLAQLQHGADDDSFVQASADRNDFVALSDVQVLSRFVSLIGAHGNAFRVQSSRTTVSSQLREGPVVLIGLLNNDWTLNRTSTLRFHLVGPEGADLHYWIADSQHPESRAWQVTGKAPQSQVVKDYAIAARFTDESTGQVILVAAGIAGSGTRAAGEFLTDEASLKRLTESSRVDWSRTSFEVVLSSEVVNGMQGKPRVEAETFW